ncbi:DNA (cytosine-5-)-methyltransferase [Rhizobium cauense]|uniref:DNA cytosine methyltransferase n=1 Tax=Rhizobium cauense TaxID=1166683 RepID=UPI001C6EF026|nr:DNA (cytosine-5-)-methyltransferase [Rhizobium cauense]MBW9116890.1 DNA (cytosine-5-)-methyltransferase [Rhizobium cauense]
MDLEAFGAAKNKIMSLQRDMIGLAMRMSDAFDDLEKAAPLKEVREQLRVECGLAPSDIRFFAGLRAKLDGRLSKNARKRLSLSSMRSLAAASAETREIAFATIAAGSVVTSADVSKIRNRLRRDRTSLHAQWETKRSRMVARAVSAKALVAVEALDERVAKLMRGLYDLHPERSLEDYERLKRVRMKSANGILADFDRLFGSDQLAAADWINLDEDDPARRFGRARHALQYLARGQFGRGHTAFGEEGDGERHELVNALSVLSGVIGRLPLHTRPRNSNRKLRISAPRRLTAVELCAGAGGMLLGMHASGFDHLAAVEMNPKAAATLRRNMPSLNVLEADIRNVDFTQYRGVDVVVGGLPCQPYSILGARKGEDDDRELFLSGVRAVREMMPRMFAFQNVSGFAQVTHARYRNVLIRLFGRAGYDVQIVKLDAQDWGVPQRRERIIVVGIRKSEEIRTFRLPEHSPDFRLNIGDALLDLMGANGWVGAKGWAERRRSTNVLRDGAIDRGVVTPTLVGYRSNAPRNFSNAWKTIEIDAGRRPQKAPTATEAAAPGFMPGLTERMRARIQGFPDEWLFEGSLGHRDQQIANAFPPRAAQAVGLALYSALEDIDFDIDVVMRAPLYRSNSTSAPKRMTVSTPSMQTPDVDLTEWKHPILDRV